MMNLLKINEMANKLEKWAEMVEPKLPEHIGHISFYGSLKKALDNSPDLAFTWLRSRMPRQLDSIQKDFNDLYEKARDVDRQRSESPGAGANILKCQAQAAAKKLAQKLRLIVKMAKEDLSPEKPAETEQCTALSKFRRIIICLKKVVEKAWQIFTKSFWESVLERVWPR